MRTLLLLFFTIFFYQNLNADKQIHPCLLLAPAVADLASAGNWAEEYLAAEAQAHTKGPDWSQEFMETRRPPHGQMVNHAGPNTQWAQEYLAQNEHKVW